MILISNNIEKILKDEGKAKSWLAKKIGLSPQGLSKNLSTGKFNPTQLAKIADALKVSVGFLFGEENNLHDYDSNIQADYIIEQQQKIIDQKDKTIEDRDKRIKELEENNKQLREDFDKHINYFKELKNI